MRIDALVVKCKYFDTEIRHEKVGLAFRLPEGVVNGVITCGSEKARWAVATVEIRQPQRERARS